MQARRLQDDIVETLRAARQAERDIIGTLPEEVRLAPGPDGGWSPKDIRAHLTSWKARQAQRHAAARQGEELPPPDEDFDAINAELHAARAEWSWAAVEEEADQVGEELIAAIHATDLETLLGNERLLGGTMGNGASHTLEHLPPLARANGKAERILGLARELEELVRASAFPDRDKGIFLYNQACFHSLGGRVGTARSLLPEALALSPDLTEWSQQDPDLVALREELTAPARERA